ncbi:Ig-like domain-containing protein [Providencia sp. PROV175]|uniref:Ig-like domain-containing protein n=2 Tax=Providencia sp. PROV175 TaxID=2949878 RepID=UPI002934F2EE|nr:Ig-like domain-containing protein [Providencia sp. PROV175]WOB91403.1 Ig-like domain-containing protein [Providencia sp. PROV175]
MTDKTITDKLKSIEIQKFKVQGLDLIVTKPDGSIENIKNGLSEVILGNMTLLTEQGEILSQDEILSSITLNVGADAIYIKEQLTSDIIEYTDSQASKKNNEQIEGEEQQYDNRQDDKQSFSEKLAELNQKNQQLEKALQTLSSEKDEKEVLLSSSLTKLTEAKNQLNQKNKAEKAQVEDSSLTFPSPSAPVVMPISSSSPSQPANKPLAPSQIAKPITQVFIQGKLSEESDSGKRGDNITNINTPIFTGVISPDSQGYLTINDNKYSITTDKDGKWSLKITEPLEDKVYEYSLVAFSGEGKPVTVNGQFEVDTQLDNLSVSLDGHSDTETSAERLTNKQVPTFIGKAEAGSTVTLTIAGQTLSAIADDKGTWRITVEKPLADGVSNFQVTAVDPAGNQKIITESVTIKTSKPDASVLLDNSTVFLTSKVKPTLTGKTDSNSNVIVKVAGKEYFTKANEQGDWSLTISDNLADGSHILNVKVTDSVGNQGVFIQSLLVDTTLPAATAKLTESSDSGAKGDNLTQHQAVTLEGITKPQSAVVIQFAGQEYSTLADKDGQWQVALPAVNQDGEYDYQVSVTDTVGNIGMSNGQFTVDNQVDSLSVHLDTLSDSGKVGDHITQESRPHFSGKAEAGSRVELTIDGQHVVTTADSDGDWTIVVQQTLTDGTYDYTVKATDVAGNSTVVTESVQIKTSLQPTTLQLNNQSDLMTNQPLPTLSGQSEPHATIQVSLSGEIYSTVADAQGAWSIMVTSPLASGSHLLKVQVTDIAGNSEKISETVWVDTTLPAATAKLTESSDSGAKGDNLTQHQAVTLEGITKPQSTVVIQFAGQEYSTLVDKDGQWQVALPAVNQDGEYDYQVSVTDTVGNIGMSSGQFIVDTQVDSLSVHLDTLSDSGKVGDHITQESRPHFSGKAEAGSRVELTIGGQPVVTTADSHGAWSVVTQNVLADGTYDYTVKATDVAGNSTVVTESVQIKTTLQPTTLQLNNQSDLMTNQPLPTLSGQSEPHATIQVSLSGEIYSTVADAQGAWSIMVTSALASGSHLLKVQVTDIAGNSEKISETVWVDTTLPAATATLTESSDSGAKGDNLTQHQAVTLEGITKPQSAVVIQFAGQEYSTLADKDGQWQVALPAVNQDGEYDYQVSVTDTVGNIGMSSGQFIVDSNITLIAHLDPASQDNSNALITYLKRPQISGEADPESKITAEFKGQIKTAYADSQGKWSLIFDVDANEGKDNHYKVIAEDAAGNKETISQSFTYLPSSVGSGDIHPPTLTATLDAAYDSGKQGDYITNIKAPKFTGNATVGAKVRLTIGNESFSTLADKVTGNWEIQVKELAEGNCQYLVTAEHPINGQTKDISGNIFIDTTAPVSTIELSTETDTGTKGNFITAHRKPVFTGKSEPGSEITLELNNESVSTVVDNNGFWSLSLPNELPKDFIGDYKIVVTDTANNQFEKIDTLTINSSKPEITDAALASPWNKGKFYGEKSTNDLMATFQGKVTPGSSLQFKFRLSKKDEHIFSISDIDKNGNWSFSLPPGFLKVDRRYDLDNLVLIATSPAGLTTEKVIEEKGIQIKDCVLNVAFQVAAESSSTGEVDNSLSSSRSPKLQGKIVGSSDRDELAGTIFIGGKTYSIAFGKSRSSWNFKVPDDVQLPLGEVPYTLTFKDVYGSVREVSSSVFISDFKFYLDPDTDSGQIGNHYTNHKKPVYKGKITAGGTISAKVNGNSYPIQANDQGEWRFEVPIKGDGAYHISFIQDDGTVSVGQTTLNILTKAPIFNHFQVAEEQLHAGTQVANVTNPKLVFTYNGNMDYYLINVNGKTTRHNKLKTKYNGSKTVFANELALPDGEHVAKITAFDIAGNKTEHEVIIKVLSDESGKTAPSIEFGVNDKQLISEKDGKLLFNQNDLTLTGTTSVASLVTIKDINGKTLGTTKANNQGSWQLKLPSDVVPVGIKDGEKIQLSVTAKDLANRETQFEFDLVYDITPPVLNAVLDEQSSNGGTIHVNQPTFNGTTKANSEVRLTINGNIYRTTADYDGNWQIKLPDNEALADGVHFYEIEAVDVLGQINQNKVSGNFIVKTVASVSGELEEDSDSGIQGDDCTNVNKPTFSGITEPNATIRLVFDNKVTSIFETTANEKGEWTIQVDTELSDGLHDYVIFAIDNIKGIKGQVSGQLVIDTLAPDYLIGGVVDPTDSSTKQNILTSMTRPTFAGIAEPSTYLEITVGQEIYTNILVDKQGEWSFTLTEPLIDGTHDYHIRVTDIAGNLGTDNLTGKITVDTQAPEILGGLNNTTDSSHKGDNITNINKPKFSGVTEAEAVIALEIDGKIYQGVADEKGKWAISVTDALIDKTYDYRIEVKDAVGNRQALTGQMTIDTKAPELVGHLDVMTDSGEKGDDITNVNTPKFSGTTEPDTQVFLTIDNHTYEQKANKLGQWEISVLNPLAEGVHDYEINAYDKAGNQAQQSGKVTIDTKAPELVSGLDVMTDSGEKGDDITNVNTPKFSGTTEPDTHVFLTIDNHTYEQKANKLGQWEISVLNPLAEGVHDYEVNVYDQAGNQAQVKGNLTIYSDLPDATVRPIDNTGGTQVDIPPIDTLALPSDIEEHYF